MRHIVKSLKHLSKTRLCSYNCGNIAAYKFKHFKQGWKLCCADSYMHCPSYGWKISKAVSKRDVSEYGMFKYFLTQFEFGDSEECWNWKGKTVDGRYGAFGWEVKQIYLAHVASYFFFIGKIKRRHGKRLYVCHSCDNGICVNPNHLWLGTHQDNMDDMVKKNRHRFAHCGDTNGMAKLTWKQVRKIRAVYDGAERKRGLQSALARKYGVSSVMIADIVHRVNWKEVR